MDITDLSKSTGLSRERIQYYEQKGIIPERFGTKHGEYYDHDVSRLKKAVILRKMGLDLSYIRKILDDSASLEKYLVRQLALLEAEKEKFDGAYNLCTALLEKIHASDETVKMEHLDADEWTEFVRREEEAGHIFVDCWQDIDTGLECDLLDPLFVKDLRKNQRSQLIGNAIGCILLCVVWGLLNIFESGFWTSLLEAAGIIALWVFASLPRYLLGKRHPHAASMLSWILPLSLVVLVLAVVIIIKL